ncbi:hypothetical protein [Oryzifoliimicrobium ureilyticus]|uniref:hypothetical protein n=1 Tax=Oryzifoliimicrobium ureilyticus TaxID=3113724 RepID=UPI0030763699
MAALLSGIGFALLGWILPMLFPSIPSFVQYTIFAASVCLVLAGLFFEIRKRQHGGSSSNISVKMGSGNKVGDIGHKVKK